MNNPIEDLFALAEEAIAPVVWPEKQALQKFKESATPERIREVAKAFQALEARVKELEDEQAQHDEQISSMEGKFKLAQAGLRSKTERCDKAEVRVKELETQLTRMKAQEPKSSTHKIPAPPAMPTPPRTTRIRDHGKTVSEAIKADDGKKFIGYQYKCINALKTSWSAWSDVIEMDSEEAFAARINAAIHGIDQGYIVRKVYADVEIGVSPGDSGLSVYLNKASETVKDWPEWKKRGADVSGQFQQGDEPDKA